MSLLNQMLQDLDARQAVGQQDPRLHRDVRSLPLPGASSWPKSLALVFLLIAGMFVAGYFFVLEERVSKDDQIVAAGSSEEVLSPLVPPPGLSDGQILANQALTSESLQTDPGLPENKREPNHHFSQPLPGPVGKKKSQVTLDAGGASSSESTIRRPSDAEINRSADLPPLAVDRSRHSTLPSIEKTDVGGNPLERAEGEFRKAVGIINQGGIAEGISGLRNALRNDASHVPARQLLVKLLLDGRQSEDAMLVLQDGLQVLPTQSVWAMSLARMQVERGDVASAVKTLERSMAAGKSSADYQGFVGHLMFRQGKHQEAIAYYEVATRLAPGDGRWWLGLGLAHDAEGRVSEAREAFLKAKSCGTLTAQLTAVADQHLR